MKMIKSLKRNKLLENNTENAKIENYDFLTADNIILSREIIKFRLKQMLATTILPGLEEEFDKFVLDYLNFLENTEESVLKGDYSYNLMVRFKLKFSHLKSTKIYMAMNLKG